MQFKKSFINIIYYIINNTLYHLYSNIYITHYILYITQYNIYNIYTHQILYIYKLCYI